MSEDRTTDTALSAASPPPVDLVEVDRIVASIGQGADAAIPICQAIQARFNYLPQAALQRVCATTGITPAAITGVATFYNQFRLAPAGRHTIRICVGTACHVKGSENVHAALTRHLKLAEGQDTDAARLFTIQKVACLGCCTLAPVVQIDRVTYGHVTPSRVPAMLEDFLAQQSAAAASPRPAPAAAASAALPEIRIGLGSCCVAGGSARVRIAVEKALAESGPPARVKRVGCVGMCHRTPLLEIDVPGKPPVLYARVREEEVARILHRHLRPHGLFRRARRTAAAALDRLLTDEAWPSLARHPLDVRDPPVAAFLDRQRRVVTEAGGQMDPLDLDEYRRRGGFAALHTALTAHAPESLVQEIRRSGLRGRGGAGFETGRKWEAVAAAAGTTKYVICNGDEGDPGAFMDRMILESYPYRVIEGMLIAAYAVGAREGFLYIRAEYPLAVQRVREALRCCADAGLLGERLLGAGAGFRLSVKEGAGAFVCGEETALIASIEGRRGMPRLRPPFPAERGLHGCPTLINNCETLAAVPWILRQGADAFAHMGIGTSRGTKVFSLTGKVARGGLIEVPMGITIRQIVEDIGGGVADGRAFKAVQIGGPSGGCLPAALSDTPVEYETLHQLGAMMGSGGLVVMDDRDCMVDMARYFLAFTQDQSCGKCTFCRIGTRRLLDILERLCAGHGRKDDLETLEGLSLQVRQGSLCGLGRTAPNPVLTTLRYFRTEYEAHLKGHCPAGRCKALIHYRIGDECIGCTLCAQNCPAEAIPVRTYEKHAIEDAKCIRCDMCRQVCPAGAVRVE
jgi:NADH-quinone oxidoreductase subunit F